MQQNLLWLQFLSHQSCSRKYFVGFFTYIEVILPYPFGNCAFHSLYLTVWFVYLMSSYFNLLLHSRFLWTIGILLCPYKLLKDFSLLASCNTVLSHFTLFHRHDSEMLINTYKHTNAKYRPVSIEPMLWELLLLLPWFTHGYIDTECLPLLQSPYLGLYSTVVYNRLPRWRM